MGKYFSGVINFVFNLKDEDTYNAFNQGLKAFKLLYQGNDEEYKEEIKKEEYKDNFIVSKLDILKYDYVIYMHNKKSDVLVELGDILKDADDNLSLHDILDSNDDINTALDVMYYIKTDDSGTIGSIIDEVIKAWKPYIAGLTLNLRPLI